jgi:phospholipid/cholesterol/gamma-HCH transport system substrate-binding protein
MQPSATRDLVVGAFVAIGLAAIAYLSLQVGGLSYAGPGGFELVAVFDEVGGLRTRAPVAIAGVTVGRVDRIELDDSLRAKVTLDLDPALELPVDTRAAVRTSGVLGDQFIALEPGAEEQLLQPGEPIEFTDPALSLEKLIGKFVQDSGIEDEE